MADIFNLADTWNDAGTVFNGIKLDVTDTASAAGSKLLDLQVGGASKFNVDSSGRLGGPGFYLVTDALMHYQGHFAGNTKGALGPSRGASWSVAGELGFNAPYAAVSEAHTKLVSPGTGILEQRKGTDAQTFNIYNTYTDASNHERAHIGWNDTADTFVIGTEAAGTGVVRPVEISAPAITFNQGADSSRNTTSGFKIVGFDDVSNRWLKIGVGSNGRGYLQSSVNFIHISSILPDGNSRTGQLGSEANYWGSVWSARSEISQGTLTDDVPALNIASTWNDAADTFTLIKADVADTASAAGSKLMDLQVGGASKFSVDSGGEVFGSGVNSSLRLTDSAGAELEYSNWRIGIGGSTAYFYQTTIAKVGMGVDGLRLADSGALRWSSGSQASTGHDLLLTRDAAGTLGQRNGVNAQTFNLYNTYTNATNYERAHIGWNDTADTFVIGTEAAGSGVARSLLLKGNNDIVMEVLNNTGSMGGIRTSTNVALCTFRGNKQGIIEGSNLTINDVPTSDPGVTGRLWNDSGTLKISA